MEIHEKIRTLEKDREWLEEERKNKTELRDSMHKDGSYPLWKELDDKIKDLEGDIARKERDIQNLQGQLQLQLFPR